MSNTISTLLLSLLTSVSNLEARVAKLESERRPDSGIIQPFYYWPKDTNWFSYPILGGTNNIINTHPIFIGPSQEGWFLEKTNGTWVINNTNVTLLGGGTK